MIKNLILSTLTLSGLLFAGAIHAEAYYVEPMICKGQWNKPPPQYHPSYERAGLKIISFWSVRSKDCSLVASSATESEFASGVEDVKFDSSLNLGSWIGAGLDKTGDTVTAQFGAWTQPLTLKVIKSQIVNGIQKDTLEGREVLFDDYYYDFQCEATVVKRPAHVENNTKNCPQP